MSKHYIAAHECGGLVKQTVTHAHTQTHTAKSRTLYSTHTRMRRASLCIVFDLFYIPSDACASQVSPRNQITPTFIFPSSSINSRSSPLCSVPLYSLLLIYIYSYAIYYFPLCSELFRSTLLYFVLFCVDGVSSAPQDCMGPVNKAGIREALA